MFRKLRRKNQELSKEECIEILLNEPRGFLGVLGDYDYPYTLPMNHVYSSGKLYFHGSKQGHKHDAIKNHSKVSYCVLNQGVKAENSWWYTFKSVIVFGKIRILEKEDEKIEKLTALGDKYFPSKEYTQKEISKLLDKTEVFEITIDNMSGKIVREK